MEVAPGPCHIAYICLLPYLSFIKLLPPVFCRTFLYLIYQIVSNIPVHPQVHFLFKDSHIIDMFRGHGKQCLQKTPGKIQKPVGSAVEK